MISVDESAVGAHTAEHGDFVPVTFYADGDGDGYGDPTRAATGCIAPVGYVATGGDCDDTKAATHPGATEACDGADDNCNGVVDEQACASCTPRSYGGHTYLFCVEHLNWFEAASSCQAVGYDLVTINDAAENEWVVDTGITIAPSTDFQEGSWWAGATDAGQEGVWTWISGQPNTFQTFAPGEPNGATGENCIHLRRYATDPYGWNDASCTGWRWHYVCEAP
jgi:hypothetical protein